MKTDTHMSGSTVKKPHLIKSGIRIQCDTDKLRADRGSWFINESPPVLILQLQ